MPVIHYILSDDPRSQGRGACFAPINQFNFNGTRNPDEATCKRCRAMLDSHTASLGEINK